MLNSAASDKTACCMCLRWFVMVDLDGLDIAISYFTESDVSFSKILKAVYCPCRIDDRRRHQSSHPVNTNWVVKESTRFSAIPYN